MSRPTWKAWAVYSTPTHFLFALSLVTSRIKVTKVLSSSEKQQCPSCGSKDTRHSYPGGMLDMLMEMFGKRPYRCRGCRRRFYRPDDSGGDGQAAESEEPVDHKASV